MPSAWQSSWPGPRPSVFCQKMDGKPCAPLRGVYTVFAEARAGTSAQENEQHDGAFRKARTEMSRSLHRGLLLQGCERRICGPRPRGLARRSMNEEHSRPPRPVSSRLVRPAWAGPSEVGIRYSAEPIGASGNRGAFLSWRRARRMRRRIRDGLADERRFADCRPFEAGWPGGVATRPGGRARHVGSSDGRFRSWQRPPSPYARQGRPMCRLYARGLVYQAAMAGFRVVAAPMELG